MGGLVLGGLRLLENAPEPVAAIVADATMECRTAAEGFSGKISGGFRGCPSATKHFNFGFEKNPMKNS
jgi:hypothetical protein